MTSTPASPASPAPASPSAARAAGIDPRGPRFSAAITATLLLIVIALSLASTPPASIGDRLIAPAALLFLVLIALFAWGAIAGVARHPWGLLFRAAVRPRLAAPTELERPEPPRFAQGVGLVITGAAFLLYLAGVPLALPIGAALAFVAAFLNAVFSFCLGCEIYTLLVRAGVLGRGGARTA